MILNAETDAENDVQHEGDGKYITENTSPELAAAEARMKVEVDAGYDRSPEKTVRLLLKMTRENIERAAGQK